MSGLPARQHGDELDAVIRRVVDGDERVVVHRGRDAVAVIPVEDLELLEAFEDARDAADFERALVEDDGERIPHEELKTRLGL